MNTTPVLAPFIAMLSSRAFILMVATALIDTLIAGIPALLPMRDQLITVITCLAALVIAKMGLEDAAAKYGAAKAFGSAPAAMVVKLQSVEPTRDGR